MESGDPVELAAANPGTPYQWTSTGWTVAPYAPVLARGWPLANSSAPCVQSPWGADDDPRRPLAVLLGARKCTEARRGRLRFRGSRIKTGGHTKLLPCSGRDYTGNDVTALSCPAPGSSSAFRFGEQETAAGPGAPGLGRRCPRAEPTRGVAMWTREHILWMDPGHPLGRTTAEN